MPKVRIGVEWGYEFHSVDVFASAWKRVLSGEEVVFRSKGWYEGESFPVRWRFNSDPLHSVVVEYGDDGAVGYYGDVGGLTVEGFD